jgi:MADS-box transcription factor
MHMPYGNVTTIFRDIQLEAEGCSNYRGVQTSWATDVAITSDSGALSTPNAEPPAAAVDCEPTLQIR